MAIPYRASLAATMALAFVLILAGETGCGKKERPAGIDPNGAVVRP